MGSGYGEHGEYGFAWEREWACMDESLEREMGMRGTCMGMRMGLHGNGNGNGNGNGLAWTGMGLHG